MYRLKVWFFRLSQALFFLWFAVTFVIFFLNIVSYGSFFSTDFPILGILFALFFLNLLLYILLFIGRPDGRRLALDSWEWLKHWNWFGLTKGMKIDTGFQMIPEEKIIFKSIPCFLRLRSGLSFSTTARDVIITNKRILIGFHISIFWYQKESFGEMNLWRSNLANIPTVAFTSSLGSLTNFLGGNSRINDMAYVEKHEKGGVIGILKLRLSSGMLKSNVELYHPNAQEIFKVFSTS